MLSKILFRDEQLSSDDTVACGTCHRAGAGGRLGTHPGADELFGTSDDIIGSPGIARASSTFIDPQTGLVSIASGGTRHRACLRTLR